MLLGFKGVKSTEKSFIQGYSVKNQLIKLIILLASILVLHIIGMIVLEGLSFMDSLWLTMTSATTVGYGDLAAKTVAGRVTTIILLYIGGIAVLAQVAAMYFEYRQEIKFKMLKGEWNWRMKNHIVFINAPREAGEEYFYQAISQLRGSSTNLANLPVLIVSDKFQNGISTRLRKLKIVHVSKAISDSSLLEDANIDKAKIIVLFSNDSLDPLSDSLNFELIDRIRDMGVEARIISEVVKDENRIRLQKAGANNVIRPIRAYPELLARSIIAPGAEMIVETLFDNNEDECIRYEVDIKMKWLDVVDLMVGEDVGIPLAYEDKDGKVIVNTAPDNIIDAKALFIIVRAGNIRKDLNIQKYFPKKAA